MSSRSGRSYGSGIKECERVEELSQKYCSPEMKLAFDKARRGPGGTAKLRSLIDGGELAVMDDGEMQEVHELRERMLECRTAELPAGKAQAYIDAQDGGVVDDGEKRLEKAEMARLQELWDGLKPVAFFQPQVREELARHPEATMTDEERQAAVDRWGERSAFLKAKREYNELLDATGDFQARTELRTAFPEFGGE